MRGFLAENQYGRVAQEAKPHALAQPRAGRPKAAMADKSKFTGLDDAATQLGVSKEKLNELREAGRLRAYRDGASWKFRTEDIESLAADPSQLDPEPSGFFSGPDAELPSLDLDSDDTPQQESLGSDLSLADVDEPTVAEEKPAAEPADTDSDADADEGSILLSEDELGDSSERPASTIIGRSQLQDEPSDDDLQIAADPEPSPEMSDVRLEVEEDEDVEAAAAGLLDDADDATGGAFDDLEELEIDLEAESSRILDEQDIAAAQAAAAKAKQKPEPAESDSFKLADSSLTLDEASGSGQDPGATGVIDASAKPEPPAADQSPVDDDDDLELDLAASSVDLQPDASDDLVLDADDESFTLSSQDSGINLKPSDSGLALDDASFGLGGSAVGSSLDLGDSISQQSGSGVGAKSGESSDAFGLSDSMALDDSVSLDDSGSLGDDSIGLGDSMAGASAVSLEGSTAFASSPDFNLQPGDDDDAEDEEDSSQIIALDAVEEPGDEEGFSVSDAAIAGSPAAMGAQAPVMAPEAAFPGWIVAFLGLSVVLMSVAAIMAVDLLTSMWGYSKAQTLESPLIQGFLGLIGLGG